MEFDLLFHFFLLLIRLTTLPVLVIMNDSKGRLKDFNSPPFAVFVRLFCRLFGILLTAFFFIYEYLFSFYGDPKNPYQNPAPGGVPAAEDGGESSFVRRSKGLPYGDDVKDLLGLLISV
jgi:hypothetical protein